MKIDNKIYGKNQIKRIVRFYENITEELEKLDIVICEKCNRAMYKDELCKEHGTSNICVDCCPECKSEKQFGDYIDSLIDAARGK